MACRCGTTNIKKNVEKLRFQRKMVKITECYKVRMMVTEEFQQDKNAEIEWLYIVELTLFFMASAQTYDLLFAFCISCTA